MAGLIELAVARDFRVPGAPHGYVVVQTDAYYAWWHHHEPDTLAVHAASATDTEWLSLRVGGSVEFAGGETCGVGQRCRLGNIEDLNRVFGAGREWAGHSSRVERVELVFVAESANEGGAVEHRVILLPDRIEYSVRCPLTDATRVRRCTLGQAGDGGRTMVRGSRVFNAGPMVPGVYHFPVSRPQCIRPDWFTPPPYCYAYGLVDGSWMSVAIEAAVGAMPFNRFLTEPDAAGGQAYAIAYDSEPEFRDAFVSPPLVFRFGASDEYAALRQHAAGMVADGKVPAFTRSVADWWRGVMCCGWQWQVSDGAAYGPDWGAACCQRLYEDMLAEFDRHGISWDILTIDMFWGKRHGVWREDPARWPDLRGFIDRQHARGRRVLLWICTNTHGLPDEELYIVGERRLYDPLNPLWLARLRDACHHMFGDGQGCLNADGLKFDFTEAIPPAGVPVRCTRELHGLDYLHALFSAVHDAAKAVRPDVLLDFQVAHPAFAGLYDMTRLNDFFLPSRQDVRVMRTRARIAEAVGNGARVDVDGPASAAYFRESPSFGNMSLYLCRRHLEDPALLAAIHDGIGLAKEGKNPSGRESGVRPG